MGIHIENDKYIFFSCDNSTVINSQRIDDKKYYNALKNKMKYIFIKDKVAISNY